MTKYLIFFPIQAMVLTDEEFPVVAADAHAVVEGAETAGVYVFGGLFEQIAAVARVSQSFEYLFSRTAWFGDDVLYLVPEEPTPFCDLTAQLWETFPAHPPYGGQFADVVPHLTIGVGAGRDALLDAESSVRAFGPVTGRAERLTLMAQTSDGRWSCRGRWALGKGERHPPQT